MAEIREATTGVEIRDAFKWCGKEIKRRRKKNDYPKCPRCGSTVTHMSATYFSSPENKIYRETPYVLFQCTCLDKHFNQYAEREIEIPTAFVILDGKPVLTTLGRSSFGD